MLWLRFEVSLKLLHSGAAVFGLAAPAMPALLNPDPADGIMVFAAVDSSGDDGENIAVLEPVAEAPETGF
ncbi:hypothetical protein DOK_03228 [gamma proteobacterium BDW918]|nr:hypothetical protein DOK_03228 [gamma proteobacterium BDW918]